MWLEEGEEEGPGVETHCQNGEKCLNHAQPLTPTKEVSAEVLENGPKSGGLPKEAPGLGR